MNYKKRLLQHLKLLLSKKGYNTAFNKDYSGFEDLIIANEDHKTTGEGYFLAIEYFILSVFVIFSFFLVFLMGFKFIMYTPLVLVISIILVLIMNTLKFRELVDKYRKDKGTADLLFLSLLFVPSLAMGGFFVVLFLNSLSGGIAFIVVSVFPWLLMLCRISVFSDDSIPKYEGPKMSIELGPGYVPIIYWLLSSQIGLNLTGYGINRLGSYLTSAHPSLAFSLTTLFLGLFCQGLVTFPDKIDKVVPVDMRMKEGYFLMAGLTIGLVLASWFILDTLKTII